MREGLRSQSRLGNPEKDQVSGTSVVQKKGDCIEHEAVDLDGKGLAHEREVMTGVEPVVQEECNLDCDMGTGSNAGLAENTNKRGSLSCGINIEEANIVGKVKKEEESTDKVQICGRLLRSRFKRGDDKISDNEENNEVSVGTSGEHHGFEKKKVKLEKEEADEFVSSDYEKERIRAKKEGNDKRKLQRKRGRPFKVKMEEEDQLVGKFQRKRGRPFKVKKRGRPFKVKMEEEDQLAGKSQRKRGRPFKVKMEEEDQLVGESQRKRGRPFKVKMEEEDQLVGESQRKRGRPFKVKMEEEYQLVGESQRKRGRPPKAGRNDNVLKVAHNGKGQVGFQKGNKSRSSEKELKQKRCSPVKENKFGNCLETENNEVASSLRSNSVNMPGPEKNVKSKAKQLVREQIWQLLATAGWTVDYRPRNGRLYNDAVYVSLDGKTHWSITLAYNRLKMHCEAGDGEGKVYGPGFKFIPIPEEEFSILTKVINKRRKSKDILMQKGKKGGNKVGVVNKKVRREKLRSGGGPGKSLKKKMKRKRPLVEEDNAADTSPDRLPVLVRAHKRQKTRNKKRCALVVRNAEEEIDSEVDGYVPYNGKRTVLAWMIDLGTVQENGKVHYVNQRRKSEALEGRITRDGIHCNCCNETVTILKFEDHARSKLCDPLKNIYLGEGTSLLQCLLDSWNKQDESERIGFHLIDVAGEDPNDDTCGVCGDGGDLICCDGCPSTFHRNCLDIQKFPSGDWHCIYCCCKFCGLVGGSTNERDRNDDFVTASALLKCHLCDQKYHRSCIEANAKTGDSSDSFFCGNRCEEVSKRLEMLLGVKHEIGDGFSCTFIRRSDVRFDATQIKSWMVESNSKLAVASLIMDECFMPYIDHRSGINLIHSILYNCGSNFTRLNYNGFFTAILERGDEIISAASIRIHGNHLAEMPFIGTRYMYRRQGMCRRLLSAIELALSSLKVELLVIPAISELRETWTSVFGFAPLDVTGKQIIKNVNLLVFPHVDMLQKKILKHHFADGKVIPTEVSNPQLPKNQTMHEVANNAHEADSSGSDLIISAGNSASNACQMDDKPMPFDSCLWVPGSSLNKTPDLTSEKEVDLDNQLCDCCASVEGRQFSVDCISTKACKGGSVGGFLQGTKNIPKEATVADEIMISDNIAEESPHQMAERIHLKSQIVFCAGASKDSADNISHDSKSTVPCTDDVETLHRSSQTLQVAEPIFGSCKISDTCEVRCSHDCVQPYPKESKEVHSEFIDGCDSQWRCNGDTVFGEMVPSTGTLLHLRAQNITDDLLINCKSSRVACELNADEVEVYATKTANLMSRIDSGGCQSVQLASDSCDIANEVKERGKLSSVAESNSLPADRNVVPDNKPWMNQSSEPPEPVLQVDQTARSSVPSMCSPATASGVVLNCASAGGTSCGNTEVLVLSNQAS